MSDFASELLRLNELREKGQISQEEFDAATAKLLAEQAGENKNAGSASDMPPSAPPQSRPSVLRPPTPIDDIPPGIKGWSWGAFLWNWIWAIFNNTWIGLLALIPGVNLVMIFVLGAKGREWAWKNKKWDSVEHFNRVQRKWSLWGIWLVIAGFVLGILMMVAGFLFIGMAGSKMSAGDFMQVTPASDVPDPTTDTATPADTPLPMTEESPAEPVAEDAVPAIAEDAVPEPTQADTISDAASAQTSDQTMAAEDTAAEQAAAEEAKQQQAELAKMRAEAAAAKAEAAKAKKDALKAEKALAEQRRRQEEERKRQQELASRQKLEQEAASWAKAQQLRAYLAALKNMLNAKHGEIQSGSPADQWLAWAHQHADRLDPLVNE